MKFFRKTLETIASFCEAIEQDYVSAMIRSAHSVYPCMAIKYAEKSAMWGRRSEKIKEYTQK